eukprot:1344214-Amorphochlora_amoeboformis.AAC.1
MCGRFDKVVRLEIVGEPSIFDGAPFMGVYEDQGGQVGRGWVGLGLVLGFGLGLGLGLGSFEFGFGFGFGIGFEFGLSSGVYGMLQLYAKDTEDYFLYYSSTKNQWICGTDPNTGE